MAIIKKVNNNVETIAEVSKVDHNQLANREQYGCHPISAIRKLPEKLTDIKNKTIDLDKADNMLKENIDQVEENARNIDIDRVGSSIKFTSYGGENSKLINLISDAEVDNDTIKLNDSGKITLNKVYTNEENIKGLGTPESPLDVTNSPDNITIKIEDSKFVVKALDYPETTQSSLFTNSVTAKNIDDRFIKDEADLINLSNKHIEDINILTNNIDSIKTDVSNINKLDSIQNDKITDLMSRTKGLGGYLNAYNFKSATPSQDDITNYAMQEIGISDKTKIFNQTKVKNLFDGNIWVLTNTPGSNPAVFSWANVGQEKIADANNDGVHGLVTGSYEEFEGSIDTLGHISINGLQEFKQDTPSLTEENNFTGRNVFNTETQFNGPVDSNTNITVTNHVLKILDSTGSKDIATQYSADEIVIEENNDGNLSRLTFPKESGTLVTTNTIDLKHSSIKNIDTNSQKEETWSTKDANTILSMTHENETTNTTVAVQKGFAEISSLGIGEDADNSSISVTSNSIVMTSAETREVGAKATTLSITPDGAEINNNKLVIEDDLNKKLDKVEMPSSFIKLYGIQKDGSQTLVNIDEELDRNSTNLVQNKVIKAALDDKLNILGLGEVNRVYVRKEDNLDSSLPFTYTAEASSIAYRNSAGQIQVEDPTQESDAANKKYVDSKAQKYLSLTGESGTLDDSQYALVTGYDNLIIQRHGLDFRRSGYPTNGTGDYVFFSDHYTKPNGTEEWLDYFITIKQDKTWATTIKNHLQIAEQTYPSVIELTPNTATNGILSDDNFDYLTNYDDVKIKLNGEFYIKMDDEHTPGIVSYIHDGWNGNNNQVKSINITLTTKAWTLVIGKNKYYRHYIQLSADGKTFYYDFSSTQQEAYTADTLPIMPDNIITAIQVVANGYYSSVSGLVYRNSENTLKIIVHGMYTDNGTSMSYLALTGTDATFVSDTIVTV